MADALKLGNNVAISKEIGFYWVLYTADWVTMLMPFLIGMVLFYACYRYFYIATSSRTSTRTAKLVRM